MVRSDSGVEELNAFETIQPLDDLELVHHVTAVATANKSARKRSRQAYAPPKIAFQEGPSAASTEEDNSVGMVGVCRYLNSAEVTRDETSDIVDILNRKQVKWRISTFQYVYVLTHDCKIVLCNRNLAGV